MHVTMREGWTDERLDDLNEKVDKGFAEVAQRFDKLEDRIEAMQKETNLRFEGFSKTMLQAQMGMFGLTITGLVGLTGLIITQM